MLCEVSQTDVWVGEIEDRPGGLADKLEVLRDAGANLELMVVRRATEDDGTAVMFVSPLRGAAAAQAGLTKSTSTCTLRIEAPQIPGLAAKISRILADDGINMRGLSGAAIGDRNVIYISLRSLDDADQATQTLNRMLANVGGSRECQQRSEN